MWLCGSLLSRLDLGVPGSAEAVYGVNVTDARTWSHVLQGCGVHCIC